MNLTELSKRIHARNPSRQSILTTKYTRMNFQMKYNHGKGLASYVYFQAKEVDAKAKACQKANQDLAKARQGTYPCAIYNPAKTIYVVEYSQLWNRPVRAGIKFKLVYCYEKFINSQKQVTAFKEWYEVMD